MAGGMGGVVLSDSDPIAETTLKLLRAVLPPRTQASTVDLNGLYRLHRAFVARIARQMGVPAPDVEDVVHDVFVLLGRKQGKLDPDASARSWIYGFTKRVVLHYHRGTARRNARVERAAQDAMTLGANPAPVVEAVVVQNDAAKFVQKFADGLSEIKREVFLLAFAEGMTPADIAEATDANMNTVYARLRTVRAEFEQAARRHASFVAGGAGEPDGC